MQNQKLISELEFIEKLHITRSEKRYAKSIREAINILELIGLGKQVENKLSEFGLEHHVEEDLDECDDLTVADLTINDKNFIESDKPECEIKITSKNSENGEVDND
jgi:hypothetical protein